MGDPSDQLPPLPEAPADAPQLGPLLRLMGKHAASDLHLKAGNPPIFRISGKIRYLETEPLNGARIEAMLGELLTPDQAEAVQFGRDLDFAYSLSGVGRFRINAFRQRGSLSLAIRRVNTEIPTFAALNLHVGAMEHIARLRQGLVVVAGVTGSGKSTTIASLVQHINGQRRCHILTIEDPIEYLYRDAKAFVNQREVGIDVDSFAAALKSVVRQDPDIIVIGEMRDPETFETALTAAETGHLVLGTVHASTVAQTIGRITDMFPSDRENQVRSALRFNLKAIVCQRMVRGTSKEHPLVPVQEILLSTPTVQKLLAGGEDKKLEQVIRGGSEEGMQDFNRGLLNLVRDGLIDEADALAISDQPEQLQMNLKGIFLGDDKRIVGG
ncbi:MAG: PilT/PilU family type 4a pilus ATPase [Planctomycetes bacterium]|nr:PilT/PilU family type 4a pilus ATPase [Planctomycetota bacterium]